MPEPKEFQIERDYTARMDHARAMYHMAVQSAEDELDAALALAEETRQNELADARRTALSAVQG